MGRTEDLAALEVATLEAELELAIALRARRRQAAGQVADLEHQVARLAGKPWRRDPFPHELEARVDFAGLEVELDRQAELIGRQLVDDRQAHAGLVGEWARTQPRSTEVAYLLTGPGGPLFPAGGDRPPKLAELDAFVAGRQASYRGQLEGVYRDGWSRTFGEAREQGVPVPRMLPDLVEAPDELRQTLDRAARQLANEPLATMVRAMDEAAYAGLASETPAELAARLEETAANLSERQLDDLARRQVSSAEGRGRTDASRVLPVPARIYASELLDGNTCAPCSHIDGREYDDEAASLVDYPAGRYRFCEGGERCRGTRVFVWPDEAPPTLRDPGDVPPPKPPPGGEPDVPGPSRPPRPPASDRDVPAWADEELGPILARLPADRTAVGLRADGTPDVTAIGDTRNTHVPGPVALEHERAVREVGQVVERRAQALVAERAREAGIADVAALEVREAALKRELADTRVTIEDVRQQALDAYNEAGAPAVWSRRGLDGRGTPVFDQEVEAWVGGAARMRHRRAHRRREEILTEDLNEVRREQHAARRARRELEADARLEVLEQARPMGGRIRFADPDADDAVVRQRGGTNDEGRAAVREAARRYPTEWLETSNAAGPLYAQAHAQRAHQLTYRTRDGERPAFLRVPIGEGRIPNVAIHELGHRMEATRPALGRLELAFHRRRSAGATGDPAKPARIRRMSSLQPGHGYGPDELAREDKYVSPYTGKEYGSDRSLAAGNAGYFELFTTGVESVLGTSGYVDGDPELVQFVLGVLAGL